MKKTVKNNAKMVFSKNSDPSNLRKTKILLENLNFCYNVKPIQFYSRIFGLVPFQIVRGENGDRREPRVGLFDFLWFVISMCVYLWLGVAYMQTLEMPQNPSHIMLVLGDAILISAGVCFGSIIVLMDMINRFRIVEILNKFTLFDKKVAKLGVYFDYKKGHRRVLLWYIAILIWSSLLILITYFYHDDLRNARATYSILYFIWAHMSHHFATATILTTYFIFTMYLCERFDVLISLLRKHFSAEDKMVYVSDDLRKEETISFIKFIGRQFDLLTGIMETLSICYSFQVMVNIGATFVLSILTFFTLYQCFLHPSDFFKQLLIVHFNALLFFSVYTIAVIYIGDLVKSKSKKTSEIVHNIINSCNDADVNVSLSQFSQQLQSQSPVATCGLFVFDWTLLYAMIASVGTYLTILIQFSSSDIEHSDSGDIN